MTFALVWLGLLVSCLVFWAVVIWAVWRAIEFGL